MEASGLQPKDTARVSYHFSKVSMSYCKMNFFYFMYGKGLGVLRLMVEPKGGQRKEVLYNFRCYEFWSKVGENKARKALKFVCITFAQYCTSAVPCHVCTDNIDILHSSFRFGRLQEIRVMAGSEVFTISVS